MTRADKQRIDDDIRRLYSELFHEAAPGQPSVKAQFQTLSKDFKTKYEEVNKKIIEIENFYETYTEKDEDVNKFDEIKASHDAILEFSKEVEKNKPKVESVLEEILGNDEKKKQGLKQKLEAQHKTAEGILKTWNDNYSTLFNKIEGLLPGATATGLAKAYQEQKKEYQLPYIIWSTIFVLTIVGMIWYATYEIKDSKTLEEVATHLLSRLPFLLPAIWLGVFASKQQSQYKRLEQEYAYKETLSKSYEGYKREIENLPAGKQRDEILKKLVDALVTMSSYNPSETLVEKEHHDKPPMMDWLNKLNGGNGVSREVKTPSE
jgi:hypothetical protein